MTSDSTGGRRKKVAGIILAAGCGSRMGKTKQLLPFRDTTLLGRVLETVQGAGLDTIVLVLGYEAGRIHQALDLTGSNQSHLNQEHPNQSHPNQDHRNQIHPDQIRLNRTGPEARPCPGRNDILVIHIPDWHKGQSFSVSAGLRALPADMDGALFLLGDQPLVTVQTLKLLVSTFQVTDHFILAPCFNGQRGNPVLVASALFDRLVHPAGDAGARVLFKEFSHRMHCLDVDDPGILEDVDTPEDYRALILERGR